MLTVLLRIVEFINIELGSINKVKFAVILDKLQKKLCFPGIWAITENLNKFEELVAEIVPETCGVEISDRVEPGFKGSPSSSYKLASIVKRNKGQGLFIVEFNTIECNICGKTLIDVVVELDVVEAFNV